MSDRPDVPVEFDETHIERDAWNAGYDAGRLLRSLDVSDEELLVEAFEALSRLARERWYQRALVAGNNPVAINCWNVKEALRDRLFPQPDYDAFGRVLDKVGRLDQEKDPSPPHD